MKALSKSGRVLLTVLLITLVWRLKRDSIMKKPLLSAIWQWKKNFSSAPICPDAIEWM